MIDLGLMYYCLGIEVWQRSGKIFISQQKYVKEILKAISKNPVFHAKTKHIDVKYHFIREVIDDKQIQLVKVDTKENLVDLLTKWLPGDSFVHCRELLGIG